MDNNQISIFELLEMDETPEIPFELQKKGMVGWIIQIEAIMLKEYGFGKNMIGVTTRKITFIRDSNTDGHGRWQYANTIDRCKGDGWMGTPKKIYAKRPTWRECQDYVRRIHKGDPSDYEIVYVRKNGDASHSICKYEEQ